MRSLKARKGARSSLTLERAQPHTGVQDLPRHQHSDPRLSVSFQSQTRWMAGEWKSWLKPNPIPLLPSTARERPSILFATTLMPRGLPPPRYSTLRSRIIPRRVSLYLKYEYILKTRKCHIYIHMSNNLALSIALRILICRTLHMPLYNFPVCPISIITETKPLQKDLVYCAFMFYFCSWGYYFSDCVVN